MDKRIKDGIYVLDGSEFWDIKYKNQTLEFIDTAGFIRSRSNRKNLDF